MDFDSLRCFITAADTLNFRAAAKLVGLSPGAFSERIRKLEVHLGAPLFQRTTRRVQLSVEGHRLLPHALHLVREAERCSDVAHDRTVQPTVELRIGTRFELGNSWLVPMMSHLERSRPHRVLHLRMGDSEDLLRRTRRRDIDACITSARLADRTWTWASLHPETYVFVGRDTHLTGPSRASEHTLLDVTEDLPLFRYFLDAQPSSEPWPFRAHITLGGIAAVRSRVLEGAGVAVLPRYFVEADLASGRLVDLFPDRPIREDTFRLVWRAGHRHTEELEHLAKELRAVPLS